MKVLMVSLFAIYSSLFSPQVLYRIIRCDPFPVVKLGQALFGFTFSSQIPPFCISVFHLWKKKSFVCFSVWWFYLLDYFSKSGSPGHL